MLQHEFHLRSTAAAASSYVVESTPARYVVIDVFENDVSFTKAQLVPDGVRLRDLIAGITGPIVCSINGQYIAKAGWDTHARPGELVVFQRLPLGGGKSNPLRMVLQIAVLVAAMYMPAAWGLVGWQASAASALINIGGMLLINALAPLPSGSNAQTQSVSPTYSVQASGNTARLEQAIPVGYGQVFQLPDFAAQPYQFYSNNEQFYCAVLCVGQGRYAINNILIDDTDIRSFSDVETAIVGPGQLYATLADQSIVDTAIVTMPEVSGQSLDDTNLFIGPFNVVGPGLKVDQISVDIMCTQGLGSMRDDGGFDSRSVQFEVQIRAINDYDKPVGIWQTLAVETHTAATAQPQQLTKTYNVPPARYQIRPRRIDEFSDNGRHLNSMIWSGARGRLTRGIEIDPNCTYLCVRMRASKQLSGMSQRRIGVEWRRLINVYRDGAWHLEHTRNPAWALYDLWSNNRYGQGLPAKKIDLDAIKRWAAICDERQDHFDYIFDSVTTTMDTSQTIAACARSRVLVRRSVFTVVRDEEQSLPVAMYNPKNMQKGSFKANFVMPGESTPDALRAQYRDGIFKADRTVIAQIHKNQIYTYVGGARPAGIPAPTRIAELKLPGVAGRHQAMRETAYQAANTFFRRQSVSWTTDAEGLLPAFGSLVVVAHDLVSWGQHASVVAYEPSTLTLTVSQPLDWSSNDLHYVRFKLRNGEASASMPCTRGSADDEIVLEEALDFEPIVDDYDDVADAFRERTAIHFGAGARQEAFVRITSIKPRSNGNVELSGVVEDARVHAADNHLLPAAGEIQDPLGDGSYDPSNTVYESENLRGKTRGTLPTDRGIVDAWPSFSSGTGTVKFRIDGTWMSSATSNPTSEILNPPAFRDAEKGTWISPVPLTAEASDEIEWRFASASNTVNSVAMGFAMNQIASQPWIRATSDYSITLGSSPWDPDAPNYEFCYVRMQARRTDTFAYVADCLIRCQINHGS